MTTLTITPNWQKKTAKIRGTVAAGEHVAVTIQNDGGEVESAEHLRLRVVDHMGRTLAVFPPPVEEGGTPEVWDDDGETSLTCELNLNTVQMLLAVPPAANVPLLFVLDDFEAKTLYFKGFHEVTHWPRVKGTDEPFDLDGYPQLVEDIEELKEAWEEYKATVSAALADKADRATTYTKGETDAAIAAAKNGRFKVVQELPSVAEAESNVIYLVPRTDGETGNAYDEWVVADGAWEKIGTADVDLTGYYNKSEVDGLLTGKVPTTRKVNNKALSADISLSASDVGALGNTGAQTLNGGGLTINKIDTDGGVWLQVMRESQSGIGLAFRGISTPSGYLLSVQDNKDGILALLSDMYAAVQQIAPAWVSGTSYAANALVTYNGVVYQNTSGATIQNAKTPNTSGSGWTAKKVSELFLPLTGGEIKGTIEFYNSFGGGNTIIGALGKSIFIFNRSDDAGVWIRTDRIGTVALLQDTLRFSTEVSYAVGNVVFYNGSFYRCTTAHSAGAWNASHFAEVLGLSTVANNVVYPTAPTPTAGDNSTKIATTAFVKGALPYAIVTHSISNNAVAADDRTVNFVDATSQTGTLTLLMPIVQTSGKSRDFYFAIKCGATPPTVTASYSPINAKGESADLTLTANATTVLRFTEIANGSTNPAANPVFVVTGGANGGGSIDPATFNTKLDSEAAAPDYDSTATYAEGEYVTYLGKLYYAKQAITTAEAWTAAHWQETNIDTRLKRIEIPLGVESALSQIVSGSPQVQTLQDLLDETANAISEIINGAS